MKVSVVVPAYNVAEFLDECLCSVLGEADGDVELVCVDDGSTDATWEIASAFAEGRGGIVKAVRQENAGAGAARNAGLAVATGDWIMFLDGDDVLAKGWRSLVWAMASRHPSAEMLGFGRTESLPVEPVGGSFESREVDVSRVVGIDAYERGMWQYAYRRDLIEGLEFERIVRVEDKLFEGMALLRATRVAVTDIPAYGYRQREGSVVHTAWTRENFGAELIWRIKWLRSMTESGKTMDSRLWRLMGLYFLEYIPRNLLDVSDPALERELESQWFDTLRLAGAYGFASWQRFAMRILGATRSRALAWLLCRLPYAAKHLIHFGTLR